VKVAVHTTCKVSCWCIRDERVGDYCKSYSMNSGFYLMLNTCLTCKQRKRGKYTILIWPNLVLSGLLVLGK